MATVGSRFPSCIFENESDFDIFSACGEPSNPCFRLWITFLACGRAAGLYLVSNLYFENCCISLPFGSVLFMTACEYNDIAEFITFDY